MIGFVESPGPGAVRDFFCSGTFLDFISVSVYVAGL